MLQSVRGGRSTHGGQLGPSALHVEGRRHAFSLGPLADSQRSCRSPSFGGRACSRPLPRLFRRADGARSLLVVHRGRHLVEHVAKCLTKQRVTATSTSLSLTASHWRLEIGASGVVRWSTCSLRLHLTVCCALSGANVSWQLHLHRSCPPALAS